MPGDTRRPPDPAAAALLGMPDACTNCHKDRDQAWAATATRAWRCQPEPRYEGVRVLRPAQAELRPPWPPGAGGGR